MTTVTLVYPYFRPRHDNSIFRLPPLGLCYIVSFLRQHGITTNLVDCTFMSQGEAIEKVKASKPTIVGVYSMFSMKQSALEMARQLNDSCELLVAGGPLPTLCPEDFLEDFDVVAVGEGERTLLELVDTVRSGRSLTDIKGIVYKDRKINPQRTIIRAPPREPTDDLDSFPFPARDQLDHQAYKRHYQKSGYTITSIITSRGCPFNCDFCSRAVFGNTFRSRSAKNIVDEIETVKTLGYDRVWFADDCFTLNRKRLLNICNEIIKRRLHMDWECLSRVDTIDGEVANKMKQAGCARVFFGLESGNDAVLALMKKQATVNQAKKAVQTAKSAGIQVGAFFILGYPGENNETILDTIRFASELPLDYLSFTMPYPIPGTSLYERVKDRIEYKDLNQPKHLSISEHKLIYHSSFSEAKLKFAIFKGMAQYYARKKLGARGYWLLGKPFELFTDAAFRLMR